MHQVCLLLIPVFAGIVAVLAVFVCCLQLRKHLQVFFESPQNISDLEKDMQVDKQITELIGKKLDDVIIAFKTQIPMASMFIGSAREEKLKEQALQELLKALPEIKTTVLTSPHVVRFTNRLWRSVTYSLMGMAAVIGLFLGLIEMGLIMLFC